MNYSSRIDRVFAHGANVQANQSIPGLNDPIINSETGSLDSDFATNGTTYSVHGPLNKRADSNGNNYTCEVLSSLPDRCTAMMQGVKKYEALRSLPSFTYSIKSSVGNKLTHCP